MYWHMNTLDQNAEIGDTIPEPVDDLDPLVDLLTILVRTEILERRVLVRVDFDAIDTNDQFVVGIDGEGPIRSLENSTPQISKKRPR